VRWIVVVRLVYYLRGVAHCQPEPEIGLAHHQLQGVDTELGTRLQGRPLDRTR